MAVGRIGRVPGVVDIELPDDVLAWIEENGPRANDVIVQSVRALMAMDEGPGPGEYRHTLANRLGWVPSVDTADELEGRRVHLMGEYSIAGDHAYPRLPSGRRGGAGPNSLWWPKGQWDNYAKSPTIAPHLVLDASFLVRYAWGTDHRANSLMALAADRRTGMLLVPRLALSEAIVELTARGMPNASDLTGVRRLVELTRETKPSPIHQFLVVDSNAHTRLPAGVAALADDFKLSLGSAHAAVTALIRRAAVVSFDADNILDLLAPVMVIDMLDPQG
jgi:predicted nucleic acid-binding protein